MRASQRESHSLFSPSTRNSAVLMTPDPTSTPMATVMESSLCSYPPISCVASEGGAPFVARRAMNLHGCALPHCAPPPAATPLVDDGPQGEGRAAEGPRVDRVGADVDGHVAVVLLQQLA